MSAGVGADQAPVLTFLVLAKCSSNVTCLREAGQWMRGMSLCYFLQLLMSL